MREIVFCTTCRFSGAQAMGPDGRTGGETLVAAMEKLLSDGGRNDVKVARQACLWSCLRHCNALFRDEARYSYVAGDLRPSRETAEAMLAWFDLHGESDTGEVPFRRWPQAMRGHFIARIPPVRS